MCGITGVLDLNGTRPPLEAGLRRMLAMVHHRGPDGYGLYLDQQVGLGSARLSIIDLAGGDQPITNEDGSLWIVFNGEIFNYVELRPPLEALGHRFSTETDTEVILHLYETYGPDCIKHLNGQFVFAIWDVPRKRLFLGRDRLGIRPLFYTERDGQLLFGSEIKTLLAYAGMPVEIDPLAMSQIFTYWSTLSPRTVFKGVYDLPPGHSMIVQDGELKIQPYWTLDFPSGVSAARKTEEYLEEFESLLIDATRIRLRADVPVGAYLSGGLDSSTITALIRNYTDTPLDTFSISFSDPEFDESPFQRQMADFLGTNHQVVYTRHADIGRIFPDVIWHTETPVLRTSPAPMYLLSRLVRENHYKVVLTGEGADEFLAGYDIFKETVIRNFWARQPESNLRPLLLHRLYPEIAAMPNSLPYLASFFGEGLRGTERPDYSHAIRWRNTRRSQRFFSELLKEELLKTNEQIIPYPQGFSDWSPLSKAQWLESSIFLPQYLLSSQGDRPGMAHSVEGRFPFLDHRVVEFCNRLPDDLKLKGLSEKYLLRQLARKVLPDEIWKRRKRPYRAPIHRSFFNSETPEWVQDALSPASLKTAGLFDVQAVSQLVQKLDAGKRLGETDDMALAGILSAQTLYDQFILNFRIPEPVSNGEIHKRCLGETYELQLEPTRP